MSQTWISVKRIFKSGFVNFWRNGLVSFVAVLVMIVALFVITSLIFAGAISDSTLNLLKDRVDINIYFKTAATEQDIMSIKDLLVSLPEVKRVEYTSRDKALSDFKERHKDNTLILGSLDELNDNPLGAILSVKAKEPSQYESIAKFLDGDVGVTADGTGIIDKVNFYQNKKVIDRLSSIISSTEKIGFSLTIAFAILAILVVFNTITLAIYSSREEISIMRLVGAGNWYIRGPFIVTGTMYGIISAVITLIIFYPLTIWVGDKTEAFFSGINLFDYFKDNFIEISIVVLISGISLGVISSFLSVRRYLHI